MSNRNGYDECPVCEAKPLRFHAPGCAYAEQADEPEGGCTCALAVPPEARQLHGVNQWVCGTHEGRGVFMLAILAAPSCCGRCAEV